MVSLTRTLKEFARVIGLSPQEALVLAKHGPVPLRQLGRAGRYYLEDRDLVRAIGGK